MSIIGLLLLIIVCGVVCGLIYRYAPIPNGFKVLCYCVLIGICLLYTLAAFGILTSLSAPVPHVGRG